MTDEELIARLRDFKKVTVWDVRDAADRIEQLVATNEALTKERDREKAYAFQCAINIDTALEQLAAARKDVDEVEAYAWELEQRLPTSEKLAAYRATIEEISSPTKGADHD